jgi:hypothetical protein
MSNAFLVCAVILNGGLALVVFWWVFRELHRSREAKRPPAGERARPQG